MLSLFASKFPLISYGIHGTLIVFIVGERTDIKEKDRVNASAQGCFLPISEQCSALEDAK